MREKIDTKGTFAILGAIISWTTGPIFIRFLTGYLDGWSQNFWRYSVAMLASLPFLIIAVKKKNFDRQVFKLALLPAGMNIIMQSFWAWSFYFISPGFCTLLSRSSLIWVAIFTMFIFPEERILLKSKLYWNGTLLCLFGVISVIVCGQNFTAEKNMIGIILMLSASFSWALYSITVRRAMAKTDSRIGFSIISIYTVLGLGIIAFAFGNPLQITAMPGKPLSFLIISGIICITFAHICYYISMQRLGVIIPSLTLSLVPFTVLVLSMIIFGEYLNLWQWLSGIVIITGSIIATLAQKHLKFRT